MIPGGWEWVIIVFLVVLLFGAKKIPELARGLGLGLKEFKKARNDLQEPTDDSSNDASRRDNSH